MIASKARSVLLGVLVVFAVCAGASSAASAANLGPFWHVAGTKLGQGISKAVVGKSSQVYSTALYGKIGSVNVKISCEKVEGSGKIWNGTAQGENEEKVSFEGKCKVSEATQTVEKEIKKCKVNEPIVAEAHSSLWRHTAVNQKKETERTNSIQVVFTPTQAKENTFAKITISECEESAFNITGGKVESNVAGRPVPEEKEVEEGSLFFPTEQQSHVWRPTSQQIVESQLELKFANNPARLQGEVPIELNPKAKFGVFQE